MDILFLPVTEIARLILSRQISSREVVECHFQAISARNEKINAIVTLNQEAALKRASEADAALTKGEVWGPLHGVPFTIKDVFATAGVRTTSGHPRLSQHVPEKDATVVARLHQAGGILIGKTNTPPFAMDNQTDNPVFGRTNNPWDLSRTPGGSSGGAAAAIAAGLSPLDVGSDLGGSIRRPAHYCGIFGLKPTDHVVPHTGHIPPPPGVTSWGLLRYLFSAGPLARSVGDLRLALMVLAGPDSVDTDVPPLSFTGTPPPDLPGLKIAWMDDLGGFPISADTRAALENMAQSLQEAGCRVERASPPGFDVSQVLEIDGEIEQAGFFASSLLPRGLLHLAAKWVFAKDPLAAGYLHGAGSNLSRLNRALSQRDRFIQELEAFLQKWDAWLLPVTSTPAFPHLPIRNHLDRLRAKIEVNGQPMPYTLATSAHLNPFNLTGSPAVVIPAGQSKEGLPIGVQLVGRRWHDMELLGVAESISRVAGGFRPPTIL